MYFQNCVFTCLRGKSSGQAIVLRGNPEVFYLPNGEMSPSLAGGGCYLWTLDYRYRLTHRC